MLIPNGDEMKALVNWLDNFWVFFRYVGVCCVIKIISVIIFLIDWWLIRQRQQTEKKANVLTVGEVVNSIISLDKRKFFCLCVVEKHGPM